MIGDFLILFGGFLGAFCSLVIKFGVKSGELKKYENFLIAIILGFAVYGIYYYLKISGFLPAGFSLFALFCFAVFLGFALDEIAHGFISLIKKTD